MKYRYTVSTNTIWTSFDYGEVEAENIHEALEKARKQIVYDFDKANHVLASADVTKGFKIECDLTQVEVKEIKTT